MSSEVLTLTPWGFMGTKAALEGICGLAQGEGEAEPQPGLAGPGEGTPAASQSSMSLWAEVALDPTASPREEVPGSSGRALSAGASSRACRTFPTCSTGARRVMPTWDSPETSAPPALFYS